MGERWVQVNASLANDIGNLLNRTLGLLTKNCGGVLPVSASEIPADHPMRIVAEQQVSAPPDTLEPSTQRHVHARNSKKELRHGRGYKTQP